MKFSNYLAFRDDYRAYGIEYAAERSARLGFDSVEFLDLCPTEEPQYRHMDIKTVKQALKQNGLTVSCCSLGANLLAEDRTLLWDQLARHIEFAAEVGSPLFHHTLAPALSSATVPLSYEAVFERVAELAVWVADRCAKYGMTCLYEPQGMYFNGVEGLQRLLAYVKRSQANVAICGDVGNSLFVDVSANDIYDAFFKDIRHVHVKDYAVYDTQPADMAEYYQSTRGKWLRETPIGAGITDLTYCFQRLREVDYHGAISLEIHGDDKSLTDALQYVQMLLKKLTFSF